LPNTSEAGENVTDGWVPPFPLSATVCGLDGSRSVKVNVAASDPVSTGLRVTETVQLELAGMLFLQVLVALKSAEFGPPMVALVKPTELVLAFVIVTVWALDAPMGTEPKLSVAGLIVRAVSPVPLTEVVCGLPVALSDTLRLALRVPKPVGVKVTLIVQLLPTWTDPLQLSVCSKSPLFVPVKWILVIFSAAVPLLERVTCCAGLCAL